MMDTAPKKTRVEDATEQIIKHILDRGMAPGDQLPNEYALANELGVGRSTLREAIKRLVSRNILETRQGSGTFVSKKNGVPEDPLGLTFIAAEGNARLALELSDVRILVEPETAALAAINATQEQIEEMHRLCGEIQKALDEDRDYSGSDTRLHRLIGECCGNSVLQNLVRIIGDAAEVSIKVSRDKYRTVAFSEHNAIVQAIEKRDQTGAKYAMLAHLNTARQEFAEMLVEKSAK